MKSYANNSKIVNRLRNKPSILSQSNINKIECYIDEVQMELDEANFMYEKDSPYSRRTLNRVSYVSVLERFYGKIVEVVVAVKVSWNKPNQWQEIIRRIDGYEEILIKNVYYASMAGYKTVWSENQRASYYLWNREYFNKWYSSSVTCYRLYEKKLYAPSDITEEEYKYIKWDGNGFLMDILEHYRQNPKNEILNQFGLQDWSGKTLNKLLDDKSFTKWIWKYHEDNNIQNLNVNEVRMAYKRNISPTEFFTWNNYRYFEKYGYSYKRFDEYIHEDKQRSLSIYRDYIEACEELGYNMEDTKTLFPRELQRMHNLRMQELDSLKAKRNEQKKLELSMKIGTIADKYKQLEFTLNGYVIILAKSVYDLVFEGEQLHHCVGKMGYDKKMADDRTLILFVRKETDVETPYVTVEYNPHEKKLCQCYADNDSKPSDDVMSFVNTWQKQYAVNQVFA